MCRRALIVEDEILVALDMESALADLGIEVVAIAGDRDSAMRHADQVDLALVDINLRDGPTGPAIGRALAVEYGVTVIFVTANLSLLDGGVEGTLGAMDKPFCDHRVGAMVEFVRKRKAGLAAEPPHALHLFI